MPRPIQSMTKPAGVPTPAGDAPTDVTLEDEIDEPDDLNLNGDDDHGDDPVAQSAAPVSAPPSPSTAPSQEPEPDAGLSSDPVVTHRITRPFSAAGAIRHPGELVDTSSWRFTKSLEAMRYIAPVNHYEPPEVFTSSDGRMWDDPKLAADPPATSPTTP